MKHGRGQAIVKRMSRIMKEANVVAKQAPTKEERARNSAAEVHNDTVKDVGSSPTVPTNKNEGI